MYEDADAIIKRARSVIDFAEDYFNVINKHFIIEWIKDRRIFDESRIDPREERDEKTRLTVITMLNREMGEEMKRENEAEIQSKIDDFENEIGSTSMILTFLNHRERMRYFRDALLDKNLETVNKRWMDIIRERYSLFGRKPLNWDLE